MIDSYIKSKKSNDSNNDALKNCLFGVFSGFLIFISSFVKSITSYGTATIVFFAIAMVGIAMIIVTVFSPAVMNPIRCLIQKIVKKIMEILLTVIVGLLYFLIVFPIGILTKKTRMKKYRYYDSDEKAENIKSAYSSCDSDTQLKKYKQYTEKQKVNSKLSRFIKFVSENKAYIILPASLFLFFLGLIFWFASSGIVQYFIYTIF